MIPSCQLTFRDFPPSSALSDLVQKKADKLDEFFNSITSCRVVIEAPHRHHQHGRHYHVRIDLTVPGGELVVDRDPESRTMHENAYAAVEDAFDDAERMLREHARRVRHEVKRHDGVSRARVKKLFADQGYGFLETREGVEVYFHQNSVLNGGFRKLHIGDEVRYAEEDGDKGPQASTVER